VWAGGRGRKLVEKKEKIIRELFYRDAQPGLITCSLVRMREREMIVFDNNSVNKKKERIYIEMSK